MSLRYIKSQPLPDFNRWTDAEFTQIERVLSPALTILNDGRIPITEISGTTHTLELANERNMLKCTHASGCTVTVPPESTTDFAVGSLIQIVQWGAAQVTVAAGSGVTIRSSMTLLTAEQYATVVLVKFAANEWALFGERAA